jgi:hypothetical protein
VGTRRPVTRSQGLASLSPELTRHACDPRWSGRLHAADHSGTREHQHYSGVCRREPRRFQFVEARLMEMARMGDVSPNDRGEVVLGGIN